MKTAETVGVLALLLALSAQAQRGDVTVHISGGGGVAHGFNSIGLISTRPCRSTGSAASSLCCAPSPPRG